MLGVEETSTYSLITVASSSVVPHQLNFSPTFTMEFSLIVSLAAFHGAAILLSVLLIYIDITQKNSHYRREKTVAIGLEICQIGLLVTCIIEDVVALRSGSHVYWYDTVVLLKLQLFAYNNVKPPPFFR
jgi:hypothetical protein